MTYKAPSEHLFELMGIDKAAAEGVYSFGKGFVAIIRHDPKEFVLKAGDDKNYVENVEQMYEQKAKAGSLTFKNHFHLSRGSYEIISVVDEGVSEEPYVIKGKLIDLFDPTLPVVDQKQINPGEQAYLFNIDKVADAKKPQVLAAASRVYDEVTGKRSYTFITKSPMNTTNVMRILLPAAPKKITLTQTGGKVVTESKNSWDAKSKTCFLTFENLPEGIKVEIQW
ncbi:MAG TPA: hypothetical protein VHO90_16345 [Bacteroidales bacterium]|nr:hypothetical protein [Bacteroidales bacterium]